MQHATRTDQAEPASGRGIASLVLGILGITQVVPLIGPLLAIFLGAGEDSSAARAGRILGWITLALYALALFGLLLFFGVFGLVGAASS